METEHLVVIIAAAIAGSVSLLVARATMRGQIRSAETSTGPDWYRELRADVNRLQGEVSDLRRRLGVHEAWRHAATFVIGRFRAIVPRDQWPHFPDALSEDWPDTTTDDHDE